VVEELARRGWTNKRWKTRPGHDRGGYAFTRTSLYKLLTNVAYAGKVRYKQEVHPGEHAAIVDVGIWQRVQALLACNGRSGGAPVRNQFGALLKGLLQCKPCGCAMTPVHTTRQGTKRYRYYVCTKAQKNGWKTCPSKSVPAAQLEQVVVEEVQRLVRDPALVEEVLAQARQQEESRCAEWHTEQRSLERELAKWHQEMRRLTGELHPEVDNGPLVNRLADLQERITTVEERSRKLRAQLHAVQSQALAEKDAMAALASFRPVWAALTPREQVRLVELLVERVDYDGPPAPSVSLSDPPGSSPWRMSCMSRLVLRRRAHEPVCRYPSGPFRPPRPWCPQRI
jgi:site-specific DNA recombinase